MIQNLKIKLIIFIAGLLIASSAIASPLAIFNYKIFYIPERGPVVETYFDISGQSVILVDNGDGILKSQVELTMIFKKGEEIVTFDKKVIDSPEMTAGNIVDFIDIERFIIPSGDYELEIHIMDLNDPTEDTQVTSIEIIVPPTPSGVFVSDIELVSAFKKTDEPGMYSKSGYDILPMVNDDELRAKMNEVVFYAEIYGATPEGVGDMFLVRAYLADVSTNEMVPSTVINLRRNAGEVVPIISRLPISEVDAGNYNIVIDIISKENETLATQKIQVTRSVPEKPLDLDNLSDEQIADSWVNKYDNQPVLFEYFHSLRPISNRSELFVMDNSMRRVSDVELIYLQRYFYGFWHSRDEEKSEEAWLEYKAKVDLAQKEFGTRNKRGYETDQGRIFLKYDSPNQIVDRANEPSSYPYIIWQYYRAGNYNNVKFVFYDPSLLRQDYQLIHSENIPGEIRNYRWQMLLKQRDTPQNNVDKTRPAEQYGGRAEDYFNNPR